MTRAKAGEPQTEDPPPDPPPGAGEEQASQAAEELAGRASAWVARAAARAREEAEDVWAEARELRRRW
jgi:hypothetical protein